jgi:hypothetical protein
MRGTRCFSFFANPSETLHKLEEEFRNVHTFFNINTEIAYTRYEPNF